MLKFSLFIFLLCAHCFNAEASDSPKKLEWGAGFLGIHAPHYRGSDQDKLWSFPMPYFTYQSERIEAEPSFIRGIFFHNKWFAFKLSLMLGLNVESKDNLARKGMPSLDYSVEAGPMMVFHLWRSLDELMLINFEWPLRYSFAVNFLSIKPIGLFTIPYLNFIHLGSPQTWNWSSEFSIGPMFADRSYHHYFYGVDPQYETSARPAYKARGGASGFQGAVVLNRKMNNIVIIPFMRYDSLKKAVFLDSPLIKSQHYALFGLGLFFLID